MKTGVVVAAIAGLALSGSAAAYADPAPGKVYAAVGADATQDLWNALASSTLGSIAS